MINLYEKGRMPSNQKEILTRTFLINKIAKDLKLKYKKIFSFINYDDDSLKNDIHFLLSKYISNNKKQINIKYIENTLLNKVREKYHNKSPYKLNNNNLYDKNDKKLIKIVNSSSKKNIYIKKEEKKDNKLPVIKNNNSLFRNSNLKNSYSKTCENKKSNEICNDINDISEIDKNINKLKDEEKTLKEEIIIDRDELLKLEEYKKSIVQQIDEINKEIEKENELLKNDLSNNNNQNNIIPEITNIHDNNNKNDINKENTKEELFKGVSNWVYNPSMSIDQLKYLERKQRIEEDCYNKQNRYIFLKNSNNIDNDISINNNSITTRPFRYNNIKINSYSMDNMRKIYEKNKNQQIPKDNINNNKNINNRYQNIKSNNFSFADFIDKENQKSQENKKMNTIIIPYEHKMQLKILKRSIAQEKAFNHLRKILSPEKEFLNESNFQGFNNNKLEDVFDKKKKEYEIADKARKIQVEKMKKLLDVSIIEREQRKKAEKEFDKKYREMNEREYDIYKEKEKQKKILKNQKMENYRKQLEEQIKQKNELMLKNDMNNQPLSLDMF